MRKTRRIGFTLVELLVVIAIIGILMSLLVPAVQKVRAAAALTQCANNMKQIGIACHSYLAEKKMLPPSRVIYVTSGATMGTIAKAGGAATNGHGWGVEILPYIEKSDLYRQFNFYPAAQWGNWAASVNQPVVSSPVPTYACPAAPPNRITPVGIGTSGFSSTNTDIASANGGSAVQGDYFTPWSVQAVTGLGSTTAALDPYGNRVTPKNIIDGLSTTILFNECAGRPDNYIMGAISPSTSASNPYWWGPWASFNAYAVSGYNAGGTAAGTACSINCNNSAGVYSFHSAGANFTFCDGSVRFISSEIPVLTLMQLFARDDGSTASPNGY
jgi:prepilin-type N-terminal cleavage/methylation domain-containing protein/prepilin-type processing-associated H-X9-DG protein